MKKYDVTLTAHYQKTVSVYAESPEQAKEKTKIILFDTDLIDFTDDDFVCGEADITEQSEDGLDVAGENTLQENEDCSDCPYFCPVCGVVVAGDEIKISVGRFRFAQTRLVLVQSLHLPFCIYQ